MNSKDFATTLNKVATRVLMQRHSSGRRLNFYKYYMVSSDIFKGDKVTTACRLNNLCVRAYKKYINTDEFKPNKDLYTNDFRKLLAEQVINGANARELCRIHGISGMTLRAWVYKLKLGEL